MILSKFWFLQFANLQNSRFTFKSVSSLNANLQTWQICPSHCKLQVLSHFYKLQRLSLQCGWLLKVPNSLVFNIRSMVLLGGLLLSDATQFLEDAPTFRHLLFFPFHYICDSTHGSNEQSNYHRRTQKHVESQRKLLRKCPHHQFGRWHGKWRPGTRYTNSFVHLQIKSRFGHVLLLVRKATLACVWSSWPGMATSNMLGKRALRGAHWYHFCPPSVFTL